MKGKKYKVREKVWLYPGMAGWHFVYIGEKQSKDIKKKYGNSSRGFGSIPVEVTLGKTIWKTSIFPSKDGPYLLPLKALVRKKEGILDGDIISFSIGLRA